jgi:hypothetical protein
LSIRDGAIGEWGAPAIRRNSCTGLKLESAWSAPQLGVGGSRISLPHSSEALREKARKRAARQSVLSCGAADTDLSFALMSAAANPQLGTKTPASLRALLAGVIDYAGLFPPASLPLEQSIRNYARYRELADHWMLGRFICPAATLSELEEFVRELFPKSDPLPIAMLGTPIKSAGRDLIRTIDDDAESLESFQHEVGDRTNVDVMELRVPQPSSMYLGRFRSLKTFVEVAVGDDWQKTIGDQVHMLVDKITDGWGFKLRTGGVEAKAFPSPQQVAFAIAACRDAVVPMKFTAGLHHPIRHYNESVQTKMHGFINVFAAATIAHAHREVDARQVQAILEDEDASSFNFDDGGLRWRSLAVTTSQIESARRDFAISFGSCSFDEPREDLRALGWL